MSNIPPLVSVIMPVFNSERYVGAAVESMLEQTLANFELIIINDGSHDGSDEILRKYAFKDNRIVYRNYNQNRGLSTVLNEGLQMARGEFIARMDSDDISHPERLSRQVNFLLQHPKVGVIGTQMNVLDAEGVKTDQFEAPSEHNRIVWSLLFGRSFAHPSIMMRKELFEKTSGYSSVFNVTEDQELWMRLAWLTQFANLPETLVNYRSHPFSVSRQKADLQKSQILALRKQFVSNILGREIPMETLDVLLQSQTPGSGISLEKVKSIVIPFLLEIFEGFKKKGLFTEDIEKVYADLMDRIVRAGQSTLEQDAAKQNLSKPLKPVPLWKKSTRALRQVFKILPMKQQDYKVSTKNTVLPTPVDGRDGNKGLSVIVLSFERLISLQLMLESLYKQDLGDVGLELIVCNNSSRVHLKQTPFTALGRALSKFSDIKILNVNYSWRTAIRYALVALAKYETILFLDDDIILRRRNFVAYMLEKFRTLKPVDILSCWNRLWLRYDDDFFDTISLTFHTPEITQLTRSDVAGPGICMFNKQILTPEVLKAVTTPEFPRAYDMGFSLIASLEHNSECYYLPSYQMLEFHEQYQKAGLMAPANKNGDLEAYFGLMLERGYKPVMNRLSGAELIDSPEQQAAKLLPSQKVPRHL